MGFHRKAEPGAKISTGSITNSTSSLTALNIEHGLGKIPTKFVVIPSSFSGNIAIQIISFGVFYNGTTCDLLTKNGTTLSISTVTPTINDTNISIPSKDGSEYPWVKGTYRWIAIAE